MKKIFVLLLLLFLWGCGKKYNNIIDNAGITYRVVSIPLIAPFRYISADSLVSMKIVIKNSTDVKSVSLNVTGPGGDYINDQPFTMKEGHINSIAEKTYTALFPMSKSYPSGSYNVIYFVTDINNNTTKVGYQKFEYDNASVNVAPVVSNLFAPDSLTIGSTEQVITLTVLVQDSNGVRDIKRVFFNSFIPPDEHASSGNPFIMYDDGTNGDVIAGDGRYSLTIKLPTNVPKGKYRWEFQAQDWSGAYSNKIIHYVVVR